MPDLPPLHALAPDPEDAEILQALCDSIDKIGKRIDSRAIDEAHTVPKELIDELAELGMFGLSLPVEHGGFGFGLWATGVAVARLARYDRSVATTVGLHLGLGSRGLVAFASPELQAATLPDMATGQKLAAFAATEPNAGSDLGNIQTRAMPTDDEHLQVDGSKVYVTNGGFADVFTIIVSTPGLGGARRGQSVLLLHREDEGVVVGAEEVKLGLRGSSTTTLSLDEVKVGMDRVVGQPGKGRDHLAHILAWGRTAMAAGCTGTSHAALDLAHRHCAVRTQFGRPLDQLAVVANQFAEAHALLFAMEALVRHTAWDDEHLEARSLAAKIHASEGSWEIADLSVQLHGGSGFIEESGVPLILRDARITRIFEGANDVLRIHLGLLTAAGENRQPLAELGELGVQADAMAARVLANATALRDGLGARMGRAHVVLHALGSLSVLRAATDAAVLRAHHADTDQARDLTTRWVGMAKRRALSPQVVFDDGLAAHIAAHIAARQSRRAARAASSSQRSSGPHGVSP